MQCYKCGRNLIQEEITMDFSRTECRVCKLEDRVRDLERKIEKGGGK